MYKNIHFCILFSITGRTALIQSSWLHAPGEKDEAGISNAAGVRVHRVTESTHCTSIKTDSFR